MIFRNDDVNVNTDKTKLAEMYGVIHTLFPDADIWSCVTLFSQSNYRGSVYFDVPFKDKNVNWFYENADSFMGEDVYPPLYKIASHGLYHIDHSRVSRDTQEMSILGSCAYLNTKIFVPPFNRFNKDTEDICFDNNIKMIPTGWKSLEHDTFDSTHPLWYFHSWRWTKKELKEVLSELCSSKKR